MRRWIDGYWACLLLAVTCLVVSPVLVSAQPDPDGRARYFSGAFVGASLGSQNIFSGARINEIDVLAQDSRRVIEVSVGLRHQLAGTRLLVGAEVQYGFTNGDLAHDDTPSQSTVTYANNTQSGVGLTAGYVAGTQANVALFGFVSSTNRTFEIDISDATQSYQQEDQERFLRYGLGVEARLFGSWHAEASIGLQTLDFDDEITNVDLERKVDLAFGVTFQF